MEGLAARDARVVWHPYAALPADPPPLPVVSAEGVRLRLADGEELVDGMSSWWAAIHGYRHPVLDAAARDQLDRMAHVMFGGLTHEPAVALAETLVAITPEGLDHVFFCDSGSVAVEVALKMALQAQLGWGRPQRRRVLAFRGGYHGDTTWAMAVCDPDTGMHHLFRDHLPAQVFAPVPGPVFGAPWSEDHVAELTRLVEAHHDELAAVIVEPIVQGAGGMRFHAPEHLQAVRRLCDEHGLLLIADEIATGFGRSGALFGCDHAGIAPDIACVGKALTGGYLSLAATLCRPSVAEAIGRTEPGALMHGPTFMANPLATAVALASVRLLLDGDWAATVARIEAGLVAGLEPARDRPGVADVRVLGAIGVIEQVEPLDLAVAQRIGRDHGVWLRPFGRLLYTMPPYVTDDEDVARITAAMVAIAGRPS